MRECQSCGGTYAPIQADGTEYYHVCPPLSSAEIRTMLGKGLLILRGDMQARLEAAQRADAAPGGNGGGVSHVEALLSTLTIERPNKRDENVLTAGTETTPAVIRAEGAGALEVVSADEAGPVATFQAAPVVANGDTATPLP